MNVIKRGMPDEKGKEIEKTINENEETKIMINAMEIALRNKMKEMELKGKQEGKLEVAKKMFTAGIDANQISEFTEIPVKDLIELIVKTMSLKEFRYP